MLDVSIGHDGVARCSWDYPADYRWYHDDEWGRPVVDDRRIYEKLCLEGFQSGLSWLTILRKRENFRRAFAGFDIEAVAAFDERDLGRLLGDAGIVRNRGKIEATIANRAPRSNCGSQVNRWPPGTADVAVGAVRSSDRRVAPAQPRPRLLHHREGPSRRQAPAISVARQFARRCYHILRNLDPDVVYAMPA